uniref:SAM domain-containing protein n=1 Tax=Aureoumbra lagunensis TaxID=44058 RepID=A0A7S3JVN9_9STRA|mmetsp:Transcript_89/g.154  ORF Transcript_89/g.154 Transcript_89/m.154 type:complete len:416 (-) Transcript_89:363-1610(-)|eukprot:CAMPEP_0197290558 /NCGR_PEP_ID=MMETSP0890-20130614/7746_1 /TAXON_ID=44058 ORGANISM="Aureoumbra lagunensis, Strain CCMP1510" /NCGR_SAMPLE_ID=MMETSP0890 /ASSEMBLY_ACC=CAM_ASM_000533 /LENGTH=415 /DNA_ID=CAMNT_0042762593 /DNA_START=3 /DNA_END=1250 /DNA_ORIENTATION=+
MAIEANGMDSCSRRLFKVLQLMLCVVSWGYQYQVPLRNRALSSVILSSAQYADEAEKAKAARRAAILAASERAAQRMRAVNEGKVPPAQSMQVEDEEQNISSTLPAEPPSIATHPHDDDKELVVPKSEFDMAKERFQRAPKGYRPFYNTGDGYLSDLAQDSVKRHWSVHGETMGLDAIERTLGARPDEEYQIKPVAPVATPAPMAVKNVEEKSIPTSPPPPQEKAQEKNTVQKKDKEITPLAAGISREEESTIAKAIRALIQDICMSGTIPPDHIRKRILTQLEDVREVIITDASRQVVETPPSIATTSEEKEKQSLSPPQATIPPPAVPKPAPAVPMNDISIAGLDASAIAAKVSSIGPAFAIYAPKFQEFALDGDFLAALTPEQLDDTLKDLGMEIRLERRRIAFALGLQVDK